MNKVVSTQNISGPTSTAYSQAIMVPARADTLYVAGQVAIAKDLSVPRDFVEQCELVWFNIKEILAAAGMSLDDIVQITCYITNSQYRDRFREVRARVLKNAKPTSTLIVVPALGQPEWLVEITAVAARQSSGN
ncbi:MAG TPA: Rid family hydrolase [Lacipirellulaceae bacterium]|nr:Rid family hydrolase [Lacipirellulaceae bacterium]